MHLHTYLDPQKNTNSRGRLAKVLGRFLYSYTYMHKLHLAICIRIHPCRFHSLHTTATISNVNVCTVYEFHSKNVLSIAAGGIVSCCSHSYVAVVAAVTAMRLTVSLRSVRILLTFTLNLNYNAAQLYHNSNVSTSYKPPAFFILSPFYHNRLSFPPSSFYPSLFVSKSYNLTYLILLRPSSRRGKKLSKQHPGLQ